MLKSNKKIAAAAVTLGLSVTASVLLPAPAPVRAQQTTPPAAATTSLSSAAAFQEGLTAYKKGDLASAKDLFQQAADADPKNFDALSWLGYVQLNLRDAGGAIPNLEKAIALRPSGSNVAEVYTNLGNAYFATPVHTAGDTARALAAFQKAAALSPSSGEAQFNLGFAYSRTGQYESAVSAYKKAVEIKPKDGKAWTNLGYALQKLNRTGEAADALQKGVSLASQDTQTWTSLGLLEMQRGDSAAAINALETARKLDPKNYVALANLGKLYADARRFDEAGEAFGAAADVASASGKNDPAPRYNQGVVLAKADKYPEAAAAYDKALLVSPNYFDALVNSGFVLFKQNKSDDAIARFKTATEVKPDSIIAWTNLAAAYARKGDMTGADASWRMVARFAPQNYDARASLAASLMTQGDTAGAVVIFKQMAALHPNSADPENALGLAYQKLADGETLPSKKQAHLVAALQAFTEALRREPKNAAVHNNKGVLHERRGEMPEAVAEYKKALAIDPNFSDARKNLARFKSTPVASKSGL